MYIMTLKCQAQKNHCLVCICSYEHLDSQITNPMPMSLNVLIRLSSHIKMYFIPFETWATIESFMGKRRGTSAAVR